MPAIDWQPPGFLFGGSTGTVVSGAMDWLSLHGSQDLTAVAIAPDFGERYLDTVYHSNWVQDLYGEDVLSSDELITASPVRLNRATETATADADHMTCRAITRSSTSCSRTHMVQVALGALTVDLADSPTTQASGARPESSTESAFAEVLAEVMGVERVSVDSNFFDDLGADSMVMARFCARVRKRPDLPAVSIKDIYQHRDDPKSGYGARRHHAYACGASLRRHAGRGHAGRAGLGGQQLLR